MLPCSPSRNKYLRKVQVEKGRQLLTVKSSHCATSGTRRVTLVTNNVISHE
jgi:hypothetical protein